MNTNTYIACSCCGSTDIHKDERTLIYTCENLNCWYFIDHKKFYSWRAATWWRDTLGLHIGYEL